MAIGALSRPPSIGAKRYVVQTYLVSLQQCWSIEACQDYYATQYSAEIVNTMTNLLFVWLAVKGITSCRKYNHDDIFLISYAGYALVGTGSFLFHSTLKCVVPSQT